MSMTWTRPRRIGASILLVLVLAIVVLMLVFDWNWLKSPIEKALFKSTGRTLELRGDITGQWRLHPRLRFEQVRLSNPEWAKGPDMLLADAVEIKIALLPLLMKRIHIYDLLLQHPELHLERAQDRRANWLFDRGQKDKGTAPIIEALRVDQGKLFYIDAISEADLTADVQDTGSADDPRSLKFKARGKLFAQPLQLAGETAPILSLRDTSQLLPLAIKGRLGTTQIAVDGEIKGLAAFTDAKLRYDIRGFSLSLLEPWFRVPLPETPKYSASGLLLHHANVWQTTDLKGKMGQSDLAGNVKVTTGGDRPRLEADLTSSLLDLADLGPMIGGTNRSRIAPTAEDMAHLLPRRKFDFSGLDKLDAHVLIKSKQVVRAANWPFDNFFVDFRLDNSRIVIDPIEFGMADGKLRGQIMLNARNAITDAAVSGRMDGVRVAKIMPKQAAAGQAAGVLSGRIDLKGQGTAVSSMLGSANGRVTVLLADGNVPSLLPALVDLDGARVLTNLVGTHPESVRCSAIDMAVAKGIATPNVAVVETDTTVLTLTGQVNLGNEAIDLKLTQAPKKPSFLSLRTPILIGGTLASPDFSPAPAPLAARGAAAALLGLINPLAAVFALIETGPGKDGTCPVIQRGFHAKAAG